MSRQALETVAARINLFREFQNKELIDIDNLTTDDANALYDQIDGMMSPENLHCDGEISVAAARKKARALLSAVDTLQSMGFAIPNDCYEIR
jgi:hypothetical protein